MSRRTVSAMIALAAFSLALTASARQYRAAGNYAVGNHPVAVAVGDLNSDGKPDLVVANFDSRSVSVLLGKGDGTFPARQDFETGLQPCTIAVTQLDGDGHADIVVGSEDGGRFSVLYGYGDGTFAPPMDFSAVSPGLAALMRTTSKAQSGHSIGSVAIGDFNGDGRPDEAAAVSGTNRLSVLLGTGDDSVPGENLLQNGGFDDRTFTPWAVGRNFCSSQCHPWALYHSHQQGGSGDAIDVGNIEMVQNFTATATSSIEVVSFWVRHPAGSEPTAIDFFYSDGSDEEYLVFTSDSAWDYFDVTADLAAGESLEGFSIWGFTTTADVSQATLADTAAIEIP